MLFAVFQSVNDQLPVLLEDLESFRRLAASALPIEASLQSAICRSAWTKCSCSLTTPAPLPQSSPASRFPAGALGFFISSQSRYSAALSHALIVLRKLSQLSATGRIGEAIGQRSAFLSAGVPTLSTRHA